MTQFDKLYQWLLGKGTKEEYILLWTPGQWTCILYVYYDETGNYLPVSLVPQFIEDLKERQLMKSVKQRGGAPRGKPLGAEHESSEHGLLFCSKEGVEVGTYTEQDGSIYCGACNAHLGCEDGLSILVKESNGTIVRTIIR